MSHPTLSEQLLEYQAGFKNKVPAGIQAEMAKATAELAATGIAQQGLAVGATAPDFALPDATGKTVRLSELLAKGPVVINFYRGEWCPYCNLELRAFQLLQSEFEAAGAQIVAISPELPDHSLSVTEKHELAYPVLSDVGNKVSREFGLVFALAEALRPIYLSFGLDIPTSNGDDSYTLPLPATYVIDTQGVVRYAFANADYTKRAEPSDALAAVKALAVAA